MAGVGTRHSGARGIGSSADKMELLTAGAPPAERTRGETTGMEETPRATHPKIDALLAIPQPEQRTEEWYRARQTRLTASDAATALGLNPYETPEALLLKKCGLGERFEGNEATAHGQRWEPYVAELFCREYGFTHHEGGLLPHPTIPFLGGSPDGLLCNAAGECALLEIKCPLRRRITGEVPVHYMPQLQLLMDICGMDRAYFVEFKPEDTWAPEQLSVTVVDRDEGWMERNLPVFEAFWRRVEHLRANPEEALRLEEDIVIAKLERAAVSEERKAKRAKRVVVNIDDELGGSTIVPDAVEIREHEDAVDRMTLYCKSMIGNE